MILYGSEAGYNTNQHAAASSGQSDVVLHATPFEVLQAKVPCLQSDLIPNPNDELSSNSRCLSGWKSRAGCSANQISILRCREGEIGSKKDEEEIDRNGGAKFHCKELWNITRTNDCAI